MGLACSHDIVKSLGGDIKVKQSQKGLTVIGFKIPIGIKSVSENKENA